MLKSLFNKVAGLKAFFSPVFSCEICDIFKNIYFGERMQTTLFYLIVGGVQIANFCEKKPLEFIYLLLYKRMT